MIRNIDVNYVVKTSGSMVSIPLCYEKEEEEGVQVLKCRIDLPPGQIPEWLKPHKFEVRALCSNGAYEALLNETRGVYTIDAALFMERAQEQVWLAEALYITRRGKGRK